MENIDERDIDAARFEKRILTMGRNLSSQTPTTVLKLAIFMLFTELNENFLSLPWSRYDIKTIDGLIAAKIRATKWLGLKDDGITIEWRRLPQHGLDEFFDFIVDSSHSREVCLNRLDYLVKSLSVLRSSNSWAQKVENFVAHFSNGWSTKGHVVADLNTMTTGELGIKLSDFRATENYLLPNVLKPHIFEVCLRLRAYDVRYHFVPENGDDYAWDNVGTTFKFAWPTRNRKRREPYENCLPFNTDGLDFAQWFLSSNYTQRMTIIILPSADLRARGWRAEIRHNMLRGKHIIGVLELPVRVSGSARLSMLIMATGQSSIGEPILLMDGRAVDGLRDEPLDRLAKFLSIPFMRKMVNDGRSRQIHNFSLGDGLLSRARKMFGSDSGEIPGFFRYVMPDEILNDEHTVLNPSHWITERQPMVTSDLLDGSPVYKLLEERELARCIYVIGNNGAGKSMLLCQLARAYVASGRPVRAIASATSDRFDTKMSTNFDYAYLGSRTSERSTQPRRLGRKLAELMVSIHADHTKVVAVNRVLEQLSFAGQHYLLPETATSDILESLRQLGSDAIPANMNGWKLGFRKTHENTIIPFDHLSTGEQQLLLLIARLVEYAKPGVIFLIDEPETSLHVAWQRALPSVFQTISRDFNCQMVIATHSPILISTSRGSDTFRFMTDGGVLEAIGEQTASSVERVLFQGFDTYTGNNREVHERCAELVSRAIEFANTERNEMLPMVLDELRQMEDKVARAVPALGSDVPALHLDLIRRATQAIAELTSSAQSEEARS
ncbi:AAA family ATPase [Providencia sp. 2024EL-00732]|uniref:AAA family ATPase n=1 Tax=Providencia sp. 2024EL-00732 TaxID=3374242 RepID=UPI0024ABF750|nr:ATP-binding protein [Providencia rettgeri]